MHVADATHVGDAGMLEFLCRQGVWNHTDHVAPRVEHRVGKHAHQSHAAAAKHEIDFSADQFGPQSGRGLAISGRRSGGRAAEDAHAMDRRHGRRPQGAQRRAPLGFSTYPALNYAQRR